MILKNKKIYFNIFLNKKQPPCMYLESACILKGGWIDFWDDA